MPRLRASIPFIWLVVYVAMLAGVSASALGAPGKPDASGEARLRQFLDSVQVLEGNFRQRVTDSRQEVLEDASGTVVMQRPGRFRWHYRQPFERVIVSDGEKLWLYEADLDQVTVRRLSEGLGDTPAALLTGRESVLEQFRVARSWRDDGLDFVSLVPLSADASFAGVTLGFAGSELRRLLLDDRLGQQTRIDFSGLKTNPVVPPGTFRFEPPAGADVIDDTEL